MNIHIQFTKHTVKEMSCERQNHITQHWHRPNPWSIGKSPEDIVFILHNDPCSPAACMFSFPGRERLLLPPCGCRTTLAYFHGGYAMHTTLSPTKCPHILLFWIDHFAFHRRSEYGYGVCQSSLWLRMKYLPNFWMDFHAPHKNYSQWLYCFSDNLVMATCRDCSWMNCQVIWCSCLGDICSWL